MRARVSEDFQARLDPALRRGPAAPSGDGDPLVALAVDLRDAARPLAAVLPRQEFRVALAERLADQARELEPARRVAAQTARTSRRREGAGSGTTRGPERGRRVRTLAAGIVAVVVAGGAGAAVASENALPGGALYPLKRQVEQLRLSLATPGQARGDTELALARERLLEAEELALASGGADVPATDTPQLRSTLDDFGASSLAGIEALSEDYAQTGDATSLAAVDTFLDETVPLLQRLRTMTPPSVHPVIDGLLADLGAHRTELAGTVASCAACREIGLVVAVPQQDLPGPAATGPDGLATAVPTLPLTTPSAGSTGGAVGTDGGLLDPLDPVVDGLPLDPVESLVDGVLPAPNPTSTPLLPLPTAVPTGVPSVSVPPVTVPGVTLPVVTVPPVTVSVPPLLPSPTTSATCLLPILGCD